MCICICMRACLYTWTLCHIWKPEGNLGESILSFYQICLKDKTQVLKLGSKGLHLLNEVSLDPECVAGTQIIDQESLAYGRASL